MQDEAVLCKRKEVFDKAKQCNPARWGARKARNWSLIKEVKLNPLKEHVFKQQVAKENLINITITLSTNSENSFIEFDIELKFYVETDKCIDANIP